MHVGVDGTRGGWVYCFMEDFKILDVELFERFTLVPGSTLVDIPIGLPENRERTCDVMARKLLSRRASSVFTVPCRKAVYQDSYAKALETNRLLVGKGFSRQFWNIVQKVREVDELMRKEEKARTLVKESHPELCFLAISGKLMKSKHEKAGLEERLETLARYIPDARERLIEVSRKQKIPLDDVIDATVLALSLSFELVSIPETPEYDIYGIPMQITFHPPGRHTARQPGHFFLVEHGEVTGYGVLQAGSGHGELHLFPRCETFQGCVNQSPGEAVARTHPVNHVNPVSL